MKKKHTKTKPHDLLLKSLLTEPEFARGFFEGFLPETLLQALDLKTLSLEPGHFVSRELKEIFSDALFSVSTKNDNQECLVSVLLEHKSTPDNSAAFQVLAYLGSAYYAQAKNREKPRPIIPLLFYHGKKGWVFRQVHLSFGEEYAEFMQYVPKLEILFINLKEIPDDHILILTNAWVRAAMLAQKYAHDKVALLEQLVRIFQAIESAKEGNFFWEIILYLFKSLDMEPIDFKVQIEKYQGQIKTDVMTLYDQLIKKGFEQGRQKRIYSVKAVSTLSR